MYDSDGNMVLNSKSLDGVTSINSGPLAGFRNAVINGNFDIWQRGTSFSNPPNGGYTADRYAVFYDGSGATRGISRQTFTLGQTDVPNEPTYFLRYAQSVAGSGATFNVLATLIEDVRTFAGKTVTISFWAKAASILTMQVVNFTQSFGTGGSPSSSVTTTVVSSLSVGTSWAKYSYSFTIPSISGKTLGSDGNSRVSVDFSLPVNTTFTLDVAQIQLEIGSEATTFERRPIGTELALCQRYYIATDSNSSQKRNFNWSGISVGLVTFADFPTTMRVTPTMTVTGDINDGSPTTLGGAASNITKYGFSVYTTVPDGQFVDMHSYTASAEL
jgi:hypothetical protein